jgi:predicted transposase/invertase (TIGR01784 family)
MKRSISPTIFKDEVFEQAFAKAELARLNATDLESYENSLKVYRDLKNVIDTAFDDGKLEGKIEGKMEGKMEIARTAKQMGLAVAAIIQLTGLSEEEIANV